MGDVHYHDRKRKREIDSGICDGHDGRPTVNSDPLLCALQAEHGPAPAAPSEPAEEAESAREQRQRAR